MLLLSTCMVQDGQLPTDEHLDALEHALKTVVRDHVGPKARLAVAWMTIPKGSAYSAGKPSTSSVVQVGVPDGFNQSAREALMHDVSFDREMFSSIAKLMVESSLPETFTFGFSMVA